MPTVTFGGVGYSVVPLLFELCSFNLLQSHANGDRCEFFGKHTHPKLPHHHKKKHPTTQSCYHHNLHRNICRCHQIIPTPQQPATYILPPHLHCCCRGFIFVTADLLPSPHRCPHCCVSCTALAALQLPYNHR